MARFIADVILIIAAFTLPWWAVLLGVACCLFAFREYYEAFAIGIIVDSLYNAPVPLLYHFQFFMTLAAIVLFIVIEYSKSRLRFYR